MKLKKYIIPFVIIYGFDQTPGFAISFHVLKDLYFEWCISMESEGSLCSTLYTVSLCIPVATIKYKNH